MKLALLAISLISRSPGVATTCQNSHITWQKSDFQPHFNIARSLTGTNRPRSDAPSSRKLHFILI